MKDSKILVAGNQPRAIEAISRLFNSYYENSTVITACNFSNVLDAIRKNNGINLIFIDLSLHGSICLEALAATHIKAPTIPVVVLSELNNPEHMKRVLRTGVRACIIKSATNNEILETINVVMSEKVLISASQHIQQNNEMAACCSDDLPAQIDNYILDAITDRQRDILELVAIGHNNKEIGRTLGISEGTVRSHLSVVFRLFNVKNRVQVCLRAVSLGLVA